MIESIFWYFFHKILGCFGLFWFVLKQFVSVVSVLPKQRVSMFRLNQNKQKTNRNSLIESILWYFSEKFRVVSVCFGLCRNSSVCFSCFDIGSKHRNKLKQIKNFCFWFHETNRNKTETDLVSVCFGSNLNFFGLFRGHPSLASAGYRGLGVHDRPVYTAG